MFNFCHLQYWLVHFNNIEILRQKCPSASDWDTRLRHWTCLDIESFLIRENITATKAFNLLFKLTLYQTYQRKNCFKLWFSDWVTYFHDRDDMME